MTNDRQDDLTHSVSESWDVRWTTGQVTSIAREEVAKVFMLGLHAPSGELVTTTRLAGDKIRFVDEEFMAPCIEKAIRGRRIRLEWSQHLTSP